MKKLYILIYFLLSTTLCSLQNTEFVIHNNGLIYSDTTMDLLKHIVDSLNLKFKVCELNKSYNSNPGAKGNYVYLDSLNIYEVIRDMELNIPWEEFNKKYRNHSLVKEDLFIIKYNYQEYDSTETVVFSGVGFKEGDDFEVKLKKSKLSDYNYPLKGEWIYNTIFGGKYSSDCVYAFYFEEDFTQKQLNEKYSRLIQYSDCLIDTSSLIFSKQAQKKSYSDTEFLSNKQNSKVNKFIQFVHESTGYPSYKKINKENKKEERKAFAATYGNWKTNRLIRIDSLRLTSNEFDSFLVIAIEEALAKGSDDEFEEYVELYYSKVLALKLKRNRIVWGKCSMDDSPRRHALEIARLSAETINWDIFLRSHLDVMNDRFQRLIDANYGWYYRNTYLKELEALEINVLDLLFGICLRIQNPSSNHYYGNIARIGRALSESQEPKGMESKMLKMISDKNLDLYNRLQFYFLFINYNNYLQDKSTQNTNEAKLRKAVRTFPKYIQRSILSEK